jgi:hypothetical protein
VRSDELEKKTVDEINEKQRDAKRDDTLTRRWENKYKGKGTRETD